MVSCYTRHLEWLFQEVGIEDTKANRRAMDSHIREALGMSGEGCPSVWKEVQAGLDDMERRKDLVAKLRELVSAA